MYNNIKEVYIGYYHKSNKITYILGVSKKKMVIKNYLENHRGLNPVEYTIERECLTDNELLIKYSDYIISEYLGYYIPEIDQSIIEIYSNDISNLIDTTVNNLKSIYLLADNVNKINFNKKDILLSALKILISFKSRSVLRKLEKQSYKTSPILFCEINEYLQYVRNYQEQRDINSRFKDLTMSEL